MAYKDLEQRRAYDREYKQIHRAGSSQTPGQTQLPTSFRLRTATDVLELLQEQVAAVLADEAVTTLERARVIGFLAGIGLRAIEAGDLAARLEAMESVLKDRKANAQ